MAGTLAKLIVSLGLDSEGFSKGLDGAAQAAGSVASTLGSALLPASALVVGGIGAIGVAAFGMSSDVQDATNDLQANLGITADRANELASLGTDIWKNNWGDNIADVNSAIIETQKQFAGLGGIADDQTQMIVQGAFAIRDTFGIDVNESISAQRTLMEQFGLTAQQASDFVTKGFQSGLNSSDDFLDSIGEYSNLFAANGADAGQFFSLMETGLGSGVLGTDKAADAFKEFGIRIRELGDDVFGPDGALRSYMSGDAINQLFNGLQDGTISVVDAFNTLTPVLQGIDNEVYRNSLGVKLFGTQWEDLGPVMAMNLNLGTTKLTDMAGATDSLNAKYNTLPSLFEGMKRAFLASFQPIGDKILEIANSLMPQVQVAFGWLSTNLPPIIDVAVVAIDNIITGIGAVITWLMTLSQSPIVTFLQANLIPILYTVAAVIGTVLIAAFVAWAVAATTAAVATITALLPIMIPIALIGGAVALLVKAWQGNWFGIRDTITNVWNTTLKPIFDQVVLWLQKNIPIAIEATRQFVVGTLIPAFQAVWAYIQANIVPILKVVFDWLKVFVPAAIVVVVQIITSILIPAFSAVWSFIQDKVIPIIKVLVEDALKIVITVFRLLAEIIMNIVVPAATAIGSYIGEKLTPIFTAIHDFIKANVTPVLQSLADKLSGPLASAGETVGGIFDSVSTAIHGISDAIDGVLGWIQKMIDKLSDVHVPSVLTQHSPSELEQSIIDVGGAAKFATEQIPLLNSALQSMQSVANAVLPDLFSGVPSNGKNDPFDMAGFKAKLPTAKMGTTINATIDARGADKGAGDRIKNAFNDIGKKFGNDIDLRTRLGSI